MPWWTRCCGRKTDLTPKLYHGRPKWFRPRQDNGSLQTPGIRSQDQEVPQVELCHLIPFRRLLSPCHQFRRDCGLVFPLLLNDRPHLMLRNGDHSLLLCHEVVDLNTVGQKPNTAGQTATYPLSLANKYVAMKVCRILTGNSLAR
jgi:hypothetical protein